MRHDIQLTYSKKQASKLASQIERFAAEHSAQDDVVVTVICPDGDRVYELKGQASEQQILDLLYPSKAPSEPEEEPESQPEDTEVSNQESLQEESQPPSESEGSQASEPEQKSKSKKGSKKAKEE